MAADDRIEVQLDTDWFGRPRRTANQLSSGAGDLPRLTGHFALTTSTAELGWRTLDFDVEVRCPPATSRPADGTTHDATCPTPGSTNSGTSTPERDHYPSG